MFIDLEKGRLSVCGRVINCIEIKADNSVTYDVGIEFVDLPDSERTSLSQLLEQMDA